MRQLFAVLCAGLATVGLVAAQEGAGKVEVKGPHICCKQCVRVVGNLLEKVEGVSDVMADVKTKTVTFTAKNDQAAKAGVKALLDGGFFGKATQGGKAIKVALPAVAKGTKADVVTVKDVHVCCGQCVKAVNNLFKDSKVTCTGPGPQKTVRIEGQGLDAAAVLSALHKGGFNGTLEK
jgi:copper chaperone CopZ